MNKNRNMTKKWNSQNRNSGHFHLKSQLLLVRTHHVNSVGRSELLDLSVFGRMW